MPPAYVLDDMQLYEVPYLIKAISKKDRPAWERTRYASLIVANAFGAKIKMKDLAFPWEQEEQQSTPDVKLMRQRMNELKKRK